MTEQEVKPCPFCGGKVRLDRAHGSIQIIFRCDICRMAMTFRAIGDTEKAIMAFNQRKK